jgi:hypothetical protein
MPHVICEADNPIDQNMSNEIGETLSTTYPGYSWHVRIGGGMVIIKNQSISPVWAMACQYSLVAHDAGFRKREIVRRGGQFLECAFLVRGKAKSGDVATKLDGRLDDKKFNPLQAVPVE